MISDTVVLPRSNETQGKAFTIHDMHLIHKYSNLDLILKPEVNLLDMEEWLLVSGTPASRVGADDDSLGISSVESPLAAGSAHENCA